MSDKRRAKLYAQCRYERYDEDGVVIGWDVSFLPIRHCKVGKLIFFDEDPEKVYTVVSVGYVRDKVHIDNLRGALKSVGEKLENA